MKIQTKNTSAELIVHSWPARKNKAQNGFQFLVAQELEKSFSCRVVEFTTRSPFSRGDIWHFHWPDGVLNEKSPVRVLAKLLVIKFWIAVANKRKIPIIWTAHNSRSHDGLHPALERYFWKFFPKSLGGVHYLSDSSRGELLEKHRDLEQIPFIVSKHPTYPIAKRTLKPPAREFFGLQSHIPVVAVIGRLRAYKGLDEFFTLFRNSDMSRIQLLLAGAPDADTAKWLNDMPQRQNEIRILRELSLEEYEMALSAADVIIAPYNRVTNSGSILHAVSFPKPVLARKLPIAEEVSQDFPSLIFMVEDFYLLDLLKKVEDVIHLTQDFQTEAPKISWATMAADLKGLYALVLKRTHDKN